MIRLAIIGNPESVFVRDYCRHLSAKAKIAVYHTGDKEFFPEFEPDDADIKRIRKVRIPKFGILISALILVRDLVRDKINVVQVHYFTPFAAIVLFLTPRSIKKIVTFWGSDLFLDESKKELTLKRLGIQRADRISVSTEAMKTAALKKYGEGMAERIRKAVFALPMLETLEKLAIKGDEKNGKHMVVCGSKASETHQHNEIIDSILRLDQRILTACRFVFPMTYPRSARAIEYAASIKQRLHDTNLDYVVLDAFLSEYELSKLIKTADVFINVQIMDAQSAAMQEYLYAGAIGIVGAWLPYDEIINDGAYYKTIDKVELVGEMLKRIVDDFENERQKSLRNKEIIQMRAGWQSRIVDWLDLLDFIGTR